jgi:hypothetical protein
MKRELFLILLIAIGLLLWQYHIDNINSEPFRDFVMPKPNPQPIPISNKDPFPFAPQSTSLLAPPPGQTASVNSYPADDPALKKANTQRIKKLLENLNGFLKNEAPGLSKLEDTATIIPLQTAEADARRLADEVSIMDLNPGVESTLTEANVYDIEANLIFLQKKWRLSPNSMKQSTEGFQASGSPSGPSGASDSSATGRPSGTGSSNVKNITLAQLLTLQTNLIATITRLTASGSTNPLLQQRVSNLEVILQNVDNLVLEIKRGTLKEEDIPIAIGQYNSFLPFVDPSKSLNINDPLPTLIRYTGASSALMNLFPYFMGGDVSGADLARQLFDKYATDLFNETSYNVDLTFNHKSESERRIAETVAKAMLNPILRPYGDEIENHYHGNAPGSSGSRGETEERTSKMGGSTDGITSTKNDRDLMYSSNISSTPAVLDWKERSKQICDQISKRELNPNDYGCLKDTSAVDANFSFRGYARMICSRLGTNYDPSIPDLCGCPPPTWHGWRP